MARNNAVSVVLCKFLILACNPSYVFLYACVSFVQRCYITIFIIRLCTFAPLIRVYSYRMIPFFRSIAHENFSILLSKKQPAEDLITYSFSSRSYTRIFICATTMRVARPIAGCSAKRRRRAWKIRCGAVPPHPSCVSESRFRGCSMVHASVTCAWLRRLRRVSVCVLCGPLVSQWTPPPLIPGPCVALVKLFSWEKFG